MSVERNRRHAVQFIRNKLILKLYLLCFFPNKKRHECASCVCVFAADSESYCSAGLPPLYASIPFDFPRETPPPETSYLHFCSSTLYFYPFEFTVLLFFLFFFLFTFTAGKFDFFTEKTNLISYKNLVKIIFLYRVLEITVNIKFNKKTKLPPYIYYNHHLRHKQQVISFPGGDNLFSSPE
jgi:hypothetical protein